MFNTKAGVFLIKSIFYISDLIKVFSMLFCFFIQPVITYD